MPGKKADNSGAVSRETNVRAPGDDVRACAYSGCGKEVKGHHSKKYCSHPCKLAQQWLKKNGKL